MKICRRTLTFISYKQRIMNVRTDPLREDIENKLRSVKCGQFQQMLRRYPKFLRALHLAGCSTGKALDSHYEGGRLESRSSNRPLNF
jgi:hypothetical protein